MSARDVIPSSLAEHIDRAAQAVEARVLAWRRDLHQHPELGNREFRTAGIVAAHLRELGLDEVRTEVAHTGVVGLLQGRPARAHGGAARRHGRPARHRGGGRALRDQGHDRVERRRSAA